MYSYHISLPTNLLILQYHNRDGSNCVYFTLLLCMWGECTSGLCCRQLRLITLSCLAPGWELKEHGGLPTRGSCYHHHHSLPGSPEPKGGTGAFLTVMSILPSHEKFYSYCTGRSTHTCTPMSQEIIRGRGELNCVCFFWRLKSTEDKGLMPQPFL